MTRSNIIIIELLTLFAVSAFALAQEIHCASRQGDFEKDQKLVNAKDEFGRTITCNIVIVRPLTQISLSSRTQERFCHDTTTRF